MDADPFDAYLVLDLPGLLDIDEARVEAAWQRLSREAHPDVAGGDTDRAASINRARDLLASPASRLRHWLERHGVSVPRQSPIDGDLMTLFSEVGETLRQADDLLAKRAAATTHLSRALLAAPEMAAQQAIQSRLARLRAESEAVRDRFADHERDWNERQDARAALADLARLGFLEKWEQQCRDRLLRLLVPG